MVYVNGISIELSSDFKLNYDAGKFCSKGYERASVGLWLQLELCGASGSMETLRLHRCMRTFSTWLLIYGCRESQYQACRFKIPFSFYKIFGITYIAFSCLVFVAAAPCLPGIIYKQTNKIVLKFFWDCKHDFNARRTCFLLIDHVHLGVVNFHFLPISISPSPFSPSVFSSINDSSICFCFFPAQSALQISFCPSISSYNN